MGNTNKRVLITGNKGFIGSWATMRYAREGYEIFGLDNESSFGERLYDKADLSKLVAKDFKCDLFNDEEVANIVKDIQPTIIVNLGGQAIVPRAFREPIMTYKSNTLGTLSILEAAKKTETVKSVLCITSDKVYENLDRVWPYRENDQLGGKDIYSVSKSSAELISSAYARTHLSDCDLNVQTVRLGNVVGGGDWSIDRLIPDLINAIHLDKKFYVRYPNATRPFQHVLDVVDGIYKIGAASLERKYDSGEGWNLGPRNNSYAKVSYVIEECRKIWPDFGIEENKSNIKEDLNLSVDVSKLKFHIGAPKYESGPAITKTFNWYKKWMDKAPIGELMEEDFKSYEDTNEVI